MDVMLTKRSIRLAARRARTPPAVDSAVADDDNLTRWGSNRNAAGRRRPSPSRPPIDHRQLSIPTARDQSRTG